MSYDEFQQVCHSALLPKAKTTDCVTSIQLLKKPVADALYRVIYDRQNLNAISIYVQSKVKVPER
jgi:hypothetical protein